MVHSGVRAAAWLLFLVTGLVGALHAQPLPAEGPTLVRDAQGQLREQAEQTRSQCTERCFYGSGVLQRETVYAMQGEVPVKERELVFLRQA